MRGAGLTVSLKVGERVFLAILVFLLVSLSGSGSRYSFRYGSTDSAPSRGTCGQHTLTFTPPHPHSPAPPPPHQLLHALHDDRQPLVGDVIAQAHPHPAPHAPHSAGAIFCRGTEITDDV